MTMSPIFIAVPKILNVSPSPFWSHNTFIYHTSVGMYKQQPKTKITTNTQEVLEKILPKNELQEKYNPQYWDPLFWNQARNARFAAATPAATASGVVGQLGNNDNAAMLRQKIQR